MSKCRMRTKNEREMEIWFKQKTRHGMNSEWIVKTIWKKAIQKIEKKTVKIKVKSSHVNKKPLAIKRIFVQTSFSHSILKLKQKHFLPENHSLFCSFSCFGLTEITTPISHKNQEIV